MSTRCRIALLLGRASTGRVSTSWPVAGPLEGAPVGYGLAFLAGAAAVVTLWFVTRDRHRGWVLAMIALVAFVAFWGLLLERA